MATREQTKQAFRDAAARYGLDESLVLAQINQESGFNPNAVGPATRYGTAKGAAQFIDGTWARYGKGGSPFDPVAAADAYARYMTDLLRMFGGDWRLALAAYNAGEGNVKKYKGVPPFKQTQDYVRKILAAAGKGDSPIGIPSVTSKVNTTDLVLIGAVGLVLVVAFVAAVSE